ncbi:hypothetical protein EDM00_07000 [Ornithobacterium rhinotracheale]|uniref:OmpP1/FadL family transporter n=1 Tax=Ornithobacterium rhinotracheale TaxID=28251 RepID=UPI00129C3C20|nr:hypothetical protein [Ornithobacterium rhinotracheale]MRI63737.1 hypothetical protein [Ornithobacterium rhinotracheale]
MVKVKNALFTLLLLAGALPSMAQKTAVSPYSSFGMGESRQSNNAATFGMGGVYSSYLSAYGSQANFMNPAANINLNYTSFNFEGTLNASEFDDGANKAQRSTAYMSQLSLAFPMGEKFRGGISFQPLYSLGYDNKVVSQTAYNAFKGDGDLNSLQLFTSYNVSKSFALGVKASYLFGNLNKSEVHGSKGAVLLTDVENRNRITGFTFTGGAFYTKKVKETKRFSIGLNYTLGNELNSDQDYRILNYGLNPMTGEKYSQQVVFEQNKDTKVKVPQNIGFGISYGEDFRWNIAAQVDYTQMSKYKLENEHVQLNNRFKASLGGYVIPNINSYKNYLSRTTYRAGAFYEKTPIRLNDTDIEKYGIAFGIGLPVGKASDPSEINIGVQLGQQGTTKNNLIKENFANVKLSFTLNDTWFQRRKYN